MINNMYDVYHRVSLSGQRKWTERNPHADATFIDVVFFHPRRRNSLRSNMLRPCAVSQTMSNSLRKACPFLKY